MSDMFLKVQCPCCLLDKNDIDDSLLLLGDVEQNMQCLHCGFASNENMKSHVNDNPFPQEFKDICRELNKRWWAPSVFTTANYNVIPFVSDKTLKWRLIPHSSPETEVIVPAFIDAYQMVEKLENLIGEQIQQPEDN